MDKFVSQHLSGAGSSPGGSVGRGSTINIVVIVPGQKMQTNDSK